MTIHEFVDLAKRVHDAERMNFGASSTREQRNYQWARIVGIARFGHPSYNPKPDNQWNIKAAGGGRPQSDDVVVSLPSRQYWDCIPSAGADGYRFEASPGGVLPGEQDVYAPPVPSGSTPVDTPVVVIPGVTLTEVVAKLNLVITQLAQISGVVNEVKVAQAAFGSQSSCQFRPAAADVELKASVDSLDEKFERGFSVEGKGGWPIGTVKGTVSLRPKS